MGTSLTGLTPATTYDALIKVGDNGPIDGTLKALSDGLGNDLPLFVSTTSLANYGGGNITSNTAFGKDALLSNTTGGQITAIGAGALNSNDTGVYNTAVGSSALGANTTGSNNTAVGRLALGFDSNGDQNTAIGDQALIFNTTGSYNTSMGGQSLFNNFTGNNNVAIGYQAGLNNTSGIGNTSVGYSTGLGITTGNYNTILGANVSGLAAGLSNNIILADGQGNQRLSLGSTGQLKLSQYTSTSAFTGTTAGFLAFDTSGNILSATSPATSPSGVAGAIQFSNGSAFASDAANLFWDDTNNRLGVGTNAPTTSLQIDYASSTLNGILINQTGGTNNFSNIGFANGGTIKATLGVNLNSGEVRLSAFPGGYFPTIYSNGSEALRIDTSGNTGIGINAPTARLHIKGSGSTSATTSLLVQNSAGSQAFKVTDDGVAKIGGNGVSGKLNFGRPSDSTDMGTIEIASSQHFVFTEAGGNGFRFADGYGKFPMFLANGKASVNKNAIAATCAQFEVESTTGGVLFPRMTTTQKNAISTPLAGLQVFDSTMNAMCEYSGTAWRVLSAGAQSVAASTATTTVDMSAGNVQNITLTASTTLTLSSAAVGTYIMKLIQGGVGSYTVTWPASVVWSGGTAPTLTTTVGKLDIVTLVFDGTNYYGTYSLNY